MALSRPTCVSTWATAATSPIQDGVEGTDSGFTWIVTDVCVILVVCPPLRETAMNLFPYKETHSFGLSPVSLLTAQLYHLVAHHVGIENPKALRTQIKKLVRASRRLSRRKK